MEIKVTRDSMMIKPSVTIHKANVFINEYMESYDINELLEGIDYATIKFNKMIMLFDDYLNGDVSNMKKDELLNLAKFKGLEVNDTMTVKEIKSVLSEAK